MKYKIKQERIMYDGFLKIVSANIIHNSFIDGETIECEREVMERGDSVAVVLCEKDTDSLLFTSQFRYAAAKSNGGWLLEIPAGSIEENEDPETCVKREVLEELGYLVGDIEYVTKFYSSPGGSTERIFLYYCEVHSSDKIEKGGGVEGEHEDIQLVRIQEKNIREMIEKEEVIDAKSIVGLQWWLINKG